MYMTHLPKQIPCYFINLDRSLQRRAFMEEQFTALGITALRIAAVDGAALSPSEIKNHLSGYKADENLSSAEIGCWLSHKAFWQIVVSSNAHYAAVFEDDVRLSSLLSQLLGSDDWIPQNESCIKLDTSGIVSFHAKKRAVDVAPFHLTTPITGLLGTAGYIISQSAAAKLLACNAHFREPVDYYMFRHANGPKSALPYRQIHPAVAVQPLLYHGAPYLPEEAAQSTITQARLAAKKRMPFGLAKIKREVRRMLNPACEPFRVAYYKARFAALRYPVDYVE